MHRGTTNATRERENEHTTCSNAHDRDTRRALVSSVIDEPAAGAVESVRKMRSNPVHVQLRIVYSSNCVTEYALTNSSDLIVCRVFSCFCVVRLKSAMDSSNDRFSKRARLTLSFVLLPFNSQAGLHTARHDRVDVHTRRGEQ